MKELPYGMSLVVADHSNTPDIYELLCEAQEESGFPLEVSGYSTCKEGISGFLDNPNNIVILLKLEERTVGMIAGQKVSGPFLKTACAIEAGWYVRPEGRKGRNPLRLLEAYESWARQMGCSHVKVSLLSKFSRRMWKRINRVYKKKGYKDYETVYMKEL